MIVSLSEELSPICYAAAHCPHFDKVERLGPWVEPGSFAVVDLKLEIRWDPRLLGKRDRGEER